VVHLPLGRGLVEWLKEVVNVHDDMRKELIDIRVERERLQDALAEQMDENGRLAARVKAFEREKEARKKYNMRRLSPDGW
jgi:phage regulator Rha-like protein